MLHYFFNSNCKSFLLVLFLLVWFIKPFLVNTVAVTYSGYYKVKIKKKKLKSALSFKKTFLFFFYRFFFSLIIYIQR